MFELASDMGEVSILQQKTDKQIRTFWCKLICST